MRLPRTHVYVEASGRAASTGLIALGLGVACALGSAAVAAAPGDANANDVADKVMDPDKLYSNFLVAEKRLSAALKKCGRAACSKSVKARLLRDLGVVYIVGLRQLDKGKEYLTRAVKADPDIELDQRVATPELEQLFMDAGGGLRARTADAPPSRAEEPPEREPEPESKAEPEREPEPEPTSEESSSSDSASGSEEESSEAGDTDLAALDASASADAGEEETSDEEQPKEEQTAPAKKQGSFVSLTLQQDFLYYPGDTGVCLPDIDVYDCFDYTGSEYDGPIYEGTGNEVASGLARATTRVLLGYDRLVGGNILLGGRLGYAFGGSPTPLSGEGFLPWHVEFRAGYYFGNRPFERRRIRPNLSVGTGLAEITSQHSVEYYESEQRSMDMSEPGKLDAWKRTGKFFLAPGLGAMIPLGPGSLTIDVRAMFLFGRSGTGMAIAAGYAIGL